MKSEFKNFNLLLMHWQSRAIKLAEDCKFEKQTKLSRLRIISDVLDNCSRELKGVLVSTQCELKLKTQKRKAKK